MKLTFLDRREEADRLRRLLARSEGALGVVYGRRRLGKSRLLREVLSPSRGVYYVGDEREAQLQRSSLAAEIARLLPGFDRVVYSDWEALFARWWREAPVGTALTLDEFPALASSSPELPSLLQKFLDREGDRGVHLLLCGSSQRMMQGLVLDRTAPLYGRAHEILRISPLPSGWIGEAFEFEDSRSAVEAYSVWGGTPRYWELARDYEDLDSAIRTLVLSPLGVLHEEPTRWLLDDLRDTTQASSILSLIGQGCHRGSEIAARLAKPITALSRPLQRLQEMELITREQPFGEEGRGSKRSLYRISDPFLRFWFRFVEVNRSRLGAGQEDAVAADIREGLGHHSAEIWEELARLSVPRLSLAGRSWGRAGRWWGPGNDRKPLEIDLVSESLDGQSILVGEVKWSPRNDPQRLLAQLAAKAQRLPLVAQRNVVLALWLGESDGATADPLLVIPQRALSVLR